MREDTKAQRQSEIEKAAYALLEARGYGGTSMLSIAKEAKASNETLYRWYGGKKGLFKAMVERNAQAARAMLETAIREGSDPLQGLEIIAPILLSMLLGEKAVALNRAAASDASGELGAAIAAGGRDMVLPLIEQLIRQGMKAGMLTAPSGGVAADWFLSLLVGDQQVRRINRTIPVPSEGEILSRAAAAIRAFRKLCDA